MPEEQVRPFQETMKTEKKQRTFVLAYFATGITQIAEIGYNFLLYKSFPIDEIGLFAWAAAVIVFFNMVVDLGLEPILTRKFGRDRLSVNRAAIATFLPRAPVIFVGIGIVVVLYSYDQLDSGQFWMLLLIGMQAVFNVSDGVCKAWLRASGRQTNANSMAVMIGLLKLSAIVVLTQIVSGTIYQLLATLLVTRAVVSIIAYWFVLSVESTEGEGEVQSLRRLSGGLLKAGIVMGGLSVLAAVQNRFDWLLVSHFISSEALATYSLANKFYEISGILVGAALMTIYPWLCRTDSHDDILLILMRLVLGGAAIMGASGAILGPPLVEALFDDRYTGIVLPLVVLMLAVGGMAASGIFYQLALVKGHERSLLAVAIAATTLQAAANLWLIPRIGIAGAATGMMLLVISSSFGFSLVVWKRDILPGHVILRIFAFVATSMLLTCVALYMPAPLWFALTSSVLAIAVLAWHLLFDISERNMFRARIVRLARK